MSNQSAGTSFHMENFKRRSRYAMVFILLILAFGLSLAVYAANIMIAGVLCKREERVEKFALVFSNAGFLGIPLVTGLLGIEAVFYLLPFIVCFYL